VERRLLREGPEATSPLQRPEKPDHVEETVALFRELYERNEQRILALSDADSAGLKSYRANYHNEFGARPATPEDLLPLSALTERLTAAKLIVLGTYHSLDESDDVLLDLLDLLLEQGRRPVLYTDLLHSNTENLLVGWRERGEGLDDLVEAVLERYPYRREEPLRACFSHLRDLGLPCHAMASDLANLQRSGRQYANRLVKLVELEDAPEVVHVLTLGQYHLARANAFGKIEETLAGLIPAKDILRVLQNYPEHYFQLAEDRASHRLNVVRMDETTLDLSYLPPMHVQSTFLAWQQEVPRRLDSFKVYEGFLEILRQLKQEFSIDLIQHEDKLRIYHYRDLGFLGDLYKLRCNEAEFAFVREQVLAGQSFYMKKRTNHIIFLGNLALSHVAEEATHYLKQNFIKGRTTRTPSDEFYYHVLNEMIGFFGSKLICPERQAPTFDHFFALAEGDEDDLSISPLDRRIATVVLEQFKTGTMAQLEDSQVSAFEPELFRGIVHAIGYLIGEYLYRNFAAHLLDRDFLKDLMINEYKKDRCYRLFVEVLQSIEQLD